ncbi:3CCCH domain-containing protein [Cryptosporidium canis]|uniref:3CCCH domain-containing protein n=1 Tax=Cryptosporidium canis TaxID=195482 RepID=A0A9D5DNR2_9CRYT|nr:3CCCH domain-containing protein [Cryptosporidium canis]
MPQFYKTKKCPWFAVGRCRMDKDCNWAHSIEELRPSVDLTRTKLCDKQLKEGICKNPLCRYAHSRKELRATSDLFKTSLCVYWIKGSCAIGDSCRYAHGIEELRSKPQKGEFVPLDVETLPIQIQNFSGQHDFQISLDGRNILYENRLYHPYAISTTSSFGSINQFGSGSIDRPFEPAPLAKNVYNVDQMKINQPSVDRNSWPNGSISLSNKFTPLSLLDIPFVWMDDPSGQNGTGNLSEPFCGSENQNVRQFGHPNYNDMVFHKIQTNNKRHHTNELYRRIEPTYVTKRSYPESIEEMYSFTPSTASSIRDKINLNLEVL